MRRPESMSWNTPCALEWFQWDWKVVLRSQVLSPRGGPGCCGSVLLREMT